MAGYISWRRRALAAATITATIAVTAAGLSACGKDTPTATNPSNTAGGASGASGGDAAIGGAPTTSPSAAGGSGGGSGANNAPTYPKDAKGYVQELVKAMAKPDYTRISQLAVQSAVQQIKDSVNGGGNPNSQWPYVNCVADTGPNQTTCVARNSHGDELTVKLNQLQLGFPTAVTEAPLQRTTYPSAPGDYVGVLLSAYSDGNQQRMVRLSSDTVKNKLACTFGNQTLVTAIDGTYSKVSVNGIGADYGKMYEFKVLTASGGKANAVKEVLSVHC